MNGTAVMDSFGTSCRDTIHCQIDNNNNNNNNNKIYAVVRFTPLRGRRTPGGADRGVPSTEMD